MGRGVAVPTPILWILACAARITGLVQDEAGAPVSGAVLDATGCDAVTDATGHYQVSCPPATFHFTVTHPDTLPGALEVVAKRGASEAPTVTLVRTPVDPGLFLFAGPAAPAFAPLPLAPLTRRETHDGVTGRQRFCVGEDAAFAAAPTETQEIWDNHRFDWKLFALDADRCAYELKTADGAWWEGVGTPVPPVVTATRSEGRTTLTYGLPPGDYVVAEWFAGFLVLDGEQYRAYGLRVGP